MQRLYPLLQDADYRVTVTLSPSELGWDVICIEPGDTTGRLYGLAMDIGSTTLEMELLDLNSGATLANVQRENRQRAMGDNILDRIVAVKADIRNLERLRSYVVEDISVMISLCCA